MKNNTKIICIINANKKIRYNNRRPFNRPFCWCRPGPGGPSLRPADGPSSESTAWVSAVTVPVTRTHPWRRLSHWHGPAVTPAVSLSPTRDFAETRKHCKKNSNVISHFPKNGACCIGNKKRIAEQHPISNRIGPSMPNSNSVKDDKRSSNSIRKRQSTSGSHNGVQAKSNRDDSKDHDNTASNLTDKLEVENNCDDDIDNFTRRLLKRKVNRSNGESDVEWEKVALDFKNWATNFVHLYTLLIISKRKGK